MSVYFFIVLYIFFHVNFQLCCIAQNHLHNSSATSMELFNNYFNETFIRKIKGNIYFFILFLLHEKYSNCFDFLKNIFSINLKGAYDKKTKKFPKG